MNDHFLKKQSCSLDNHCTELYCYWTAECRCLVWSIDSYKKAKCGDQLIHFYKNSQSFNIAKMKFLAVSWIQLKFFFFCLKVTHRYVNKLCCEVLNAAFTLPISLCGSCKRVANFQQAGQAEPSWR